MTEAPTQGHRAAFLIRDADTDDSRALKFVASTSGVKRDGIDLKLAGGNFTNFEANPVFLWAHDYSGATLPIGKVTKIRKLKSRIDVDVEFDPDDDFAQRVEKKYRDGYLNAVSIGWDVLEWERGDDDGFTVTEWDLLDVSAVPVPGDPTALLHAQRTYREDLGIREGAALEVVVEPDPTDTDYSVLVGQIDNVTELVTALSAKIEALEVDDDTPLLPELGESPDVATLEALSDMLDAFTTKETDDV